MTRGSRRELLAGQRETSPATRPVMEGAFHRAADGIGGARRRLRRRCSRVSSRVGFARVARRLGRLDARGGLSVLPLAMCAVNDGCPLRVRRRVGSPQARNGSADWRQIACRRAATTTPVARVTGLRARLAEHRAADATRHAPLASGPARPRAPGPIRDTCCQMTAPSAAEGIHIAVSKSHSAPCGWTRASSVVLCDKRSVHGAADWLSVAERGDQGLSANPAVQCRSAPRGQLSCGLRGLPLDSPAETPHVVAEAWRGGRSLSRRKAWDSHLRKPSNACQTRSPVPRTFQLTSSRERHYSRTT